MDQLPQTTLFMLMSVDGKISTGSGNERDFDKDLPGFDGVREGLQQYYDLEQETDLFSFNTGKVMAKVGWNEEKPKIEPLPVSFVIVDNKPHLTSRGASNLIRRSKKVYVVTTNRAHPALDLSTEKLEVMQYEDHIDFVDLFQRLRRKGVGRMTVQSGGEMNACLLREGLIHYVSIVVVPILVGGRLTPTLVDGDTLETITDLTKLKALRLLDAKPLADSYLHLKYEVIGNE